MRRALGIPLAMAALVLALAACVPEPESATTPSPGPPATGTTAPPDPTTGPTAAPAPTTPPGAVPIPTDCRSLVSTAVLAQLDGIPLNDPAFAPTGVQPDGSLVCVWRDPGADTTGLVTEITRIDQNDALDLLNGLVDAEGFTCYRPDEGTRCERTFPNPDFPVTDGRTLYYRQGLLLDTSFSNLAPTGYTASIVDAVFAAVPATPAG